MPPRIEIPKEVLIFNPKFNSKSGRIVINALLKAKKFRLTHSHIFEFSIPMVGKFSSRGNKKPIGRKKVLNRDRLRKRKEALYKSFTKENILW